MDVCADPGDMGIFITAASVIPLMPDKSIVVLDDCFSDPLFTTSLQPNSRALWYHNVHASAHPATRLHGL